MKNTLHLPHFVFQNGNGDKREVDVQIFKDEALAVVVFTHKILPPAEDPYGSVDIMNRIVLKLHEQPNVFFEHAFDGTDMEVFFNIKVMWDRTRQTFIQPFWVRTTREAVESLIQMQFRLDYRTQ